RADRGGRRGGSGPTPDGGTSGRGRAVRRPTRRAFCTGPWWYANGVERRGLQPPRRSCSTRAPMSYADLLRPHAADPSLASRAFLRFEDATWTFAETLQAASAYAHLFLARRDPGQPFHVGLLLENWPDFVLAQLGPGLCGAAATGLNPTLRGKPLAAHVHPAQ